MIEKISFGITETDDNSQNSVNIFSPDIESKSLTEKSQEIIKVPASTTDMSISFGNGITTPTLIVLQSDKDLSITINDGTTEIDLEVKAGEVYRLPTGVSSITVTNASATDDAYLTKIIGE